MDFPKLSRELLLAELVELPATGVDEVGARLLERIVTLVQELRGIGRRPTADDFEAALERDVTSLDVFRLFLALSQDACAHAISAAAGMERATWDRCRALALKEPDRLAAALFELGLANLIADQLERRWDVTDVLAERYRMGRGRAVRGQQRGRGLEDEIEAILHGMKLPYQRGGNFVGREEKTAKCDFAIPMRGHPKIVVEAKGFEATGSKLTDFIGDVLKIVEAKEYRMYFFVVTDGRGWRNRQSDLAILVRKQNSGDVDMVYTRARLDQLARDIAQIWTHER